jgi:hypothetical protein
MKFNFVILFVIFVLYGCSDGLVKNTYEHTRDGNNEDTHTAFIVLSNVELNQSEIEKIKGDYKNETENTRRFLYEYLLAKRTQEEKYILSFVTNSKNNFNILINNTSIWIAVGNPFLELLSIYSKTNDDALSVLLELVSESDGANQSIISSNLRDGYEINPARFIAITKKNKLDVNKILLLMEDE